MDVRKLKQRKVKYGFVLAVLFTVTFTLIAIAKTTKIKADESHKIGQTQLEEPSKQDKLSRASLYAGTEKLIDTADFIETPAGDKTAVLENPVNHSKLGFVKVAFPEDYVPWSGKALDNVSWVIKDPDGVSMTDPKKVPLDIPYINNKKLYSGKVPSSSIYWNSLNKQDSTPLDIKFYKHKNKNILKSIIKDTQNKLIYVYVLRLELNLNFSVNLYMINDDPLSKDNKTAKSASMLHYVDANYYSKGLVEYDFSESDYNQLINLSPMGEKKKITIRIKNTLGQWLSDNRRFNLFDSREEIGGVFAADLNIFGEDFKQPGIEDVVFPPNLVQLMIQPVYQLGVPPKKIKYQEALKSGFEIFVGEEIDYLDLNMSPDELQVYDSFKEATIASINYNVDKFTATSKSGKLYILDYEENEHLIDEYVVNDMKPVEKSFALPREMLPEDLEVGTYNLGIVTNDNNFLSSQEKVIQVHVNQLKAAPQLGIIQQGKPFNIPASDLVKVTGLIAGHNATIEYVGESTIDTSVADKIHYLSVRVRDEQVSPVEEKTVRVPVLVYKELPPLINATYLHVEDIEIKESELNVETNDINSWILEKSSALGWYSTERERFLIDGVELSVSRTSLTPTSKAGNYTATITAAFPNGEIKTQDITITILPEKIAYPQPTIEGTEDQKDGKIKAIISQPLPKQPTAEAYENLALSVNLGKYAEKNNTTKVMIGTTDWTSKVTVTTGSTPAPESAFTVKHSISSAVLKEMSESQTGEATLTIIIETPMKKNDETLMSTFNKTTQNFELPIRVRASNQDIPVHAMAKVKMQPPTATAVTGKKVVVGTSTKELKTEEYITNLSSMLSFDTVEIVGLEEKILTKTGADTLAVLVKSTLTEVTNTISIPIQVVAAKVPYTAPTIKAKEPIVGEETFELSSKIEMGLPKQAETAYYQALNLEINLGKFAKEEYQTTVKIGEAEWTDKIPQTMQRNATGELLLTYQLNQAMVQKMSESQAEEAVLIIEVTAPLSTDDQEIMDFFIYESVSGKTINKFELPIAVKEAFVDPKGSTAKAIVYPPMPEVTVKQPVRELLQGTTKATLKVEDFVSAKSRFSFEHLTTEIIPYPPVLDQLGDQFLQIAIGTDLTLQGDIYDVPIKVIPNKIKIPAPTIEGLTDTKDGLVKALIKQPLPKQALDRYYEDLDLTVTLGQYTEEKVEAKVMIGITDWTKEVPMKAAVTKEGYVVTYTLSAALVKQLSESQANAELSIHLETPMKKTDKEVVAKRFNQATGQFDFPVAVKASNQRTEANDTACVAMVLDGKPLSGKILEVGTEASTLVGDEYVSDLTSMLTFDTVSIVGIEKKLFETAGEDRLDVRIKSNETGVTKLISVPVTITASPIAYIHLSENIELKNEGEGVKGEGEVSYTGNNKNAVIYVKANPTFKMENVSKTDQVDVPLYKENGDPVGDNQLLAVLNNTRASNKFFVRTLQKKFNVVDIYNGTFLVDFEIAAQ